MADPASFDAPRPDDGAAPPGVALAPAYRPHGARARHDQRTADQRRGTGGETLADALGVFSIGLGLAETLAPGAVARLVGVDPQSDRVRNTLRLLGMRELASGLGILTRRQPSGWVWSRVAGDALDLGLLAGALADRENARGRTLLAAGAVLGVTALDVMNARQLSRQRPAAIGASHDDDRILEHRRAITVARPIDEVYGYWRDFEKLPTFMRHLERVDVLDERRSHWVAKAPAGAEVAWDAELVEDVPNERIAWRSLPGSTVHNAGTVEFRPAPQDMGTEVHVVLEYRPPLGRLGATFAKLFREEPGQQLFDDLRHFKQVLELGEIVVSDATKRRGMHPARPDSGPIEA